MRLARRRLRGRVVGALVRSAPAPPSPASSPSRGGARSRTSPGSADAGRRCRARRGIYASHPHRTASATNRRPTRSAPRFGAWSPTPGVRPTSRCSRRPSARASERTVASWPDREALVEVASGRRWTWAELARDVDAFARGLLAEGLQVGDRVGIWSPNCAEWTIAQVATATAGIVLVNINPAYRTHELAYAVNQSGLRWLLAASTQEFKGGRPATTGRWSRRWHRSAPASSAPSSSTPTTGPRSSRPASDCPTTPSPSGWPGCRRPTRSTSSTPRARRASRRARRSATATSSTTATSPPRRSGSPTRTGSASRCRSTTASGW